MWVSVCKHAALQMCESVVVPALLGTKPLDAKDMSVRDSLLFC